MPTPQSHPRWLQLRLARACHRAALRLAPRHVVDGHRDEMLTTFAAASDAAASQGRIALFRLLARELWDLAIARRTDRATHHLASDAASQPEASTMLTNLLNPRQLMQAARSLAHRPAFAAAAILTLAFGTATTTTLFGIVDTVLLKPLPYPNADRLVTIQETNSSKRGQVSLIAPVRLEDWNRLSETFAALAGNYSENVTDTSGGDPERLEGRRVTPRFFEVYGVDPIAGRTFTSDEEHFGGPTSVIISESFWTRRFNRAPAAIGARLTIGGKGFTIVGVMPRLFSAAATDLWLPAQTPPYILQSRDARFLTGVARMKPGVTIERARGDLARVQRALGDQYPKTDKNWSVAATDLKGARVGTQDRTLWPIFGAVGLLWLIGVSNLAGLMLVQMRRRSREIAIRTAIGASRADIVGVVLREGLLLSIAGAAAGAAIAAWLIGVVRTTVTSLPRLNELSTDWRALAFAAGSSLIAVLLFSLWPALHSTRGRLASRMNQGGRGSSTGRHRLQRMLVGAQVALSVLLVAAAALLVRSYFNLSHLDLGFSAENVITFHVGARWDEDRDRVGELQSQLISGLQTLPGVEAAGFANFLPTMSATLRYQVSVVGLTGPESNGTMSVGSRMIGGTYLQALRVPLVAGTWCPPLKHDFKAPSTVILNRRFADEFGSGQNLVGRDLEYAQNPGTKLTIVGITGDVAEDSPGAAPMPYVYSCDSAGSWPDPEYVVRTRDARATIPAIRQLARSLDASRAVFGLRTLADVAGSSLDQPRLSAGLLGVFATAAMTLAGLGLYSLFMLMVGESTREIGVRMALGAAPGHVRRLVLAGAGRLLAAGMGIGLLLSAAASKLLGALLFGVTPMDPVTLAAATLTLGVVSVIAVTVPAMRAGRVDPIVAMKSE